MICPFSKPAANLIHSSNASNFSDRRFFLPIIYGYASLRHCFALYSPLCIQRKLIYLIRPLIPQRGFCLTNDIQARCCQTAGKCTICSGYGFGYSSSRRSVCPLAHILRLLVPDTVFSLPYPEPGSHKRQTAVSIQLCNRKLQFLVHNLICAPYDITSIDGKTEYAGI